MCLCRRELEQVNLPLTASGLSEAISSLDVAALDMYRRACAEPHLIEAAFRIKHDNESAFWNMLSVKDREAAAALWISNVIQDGVNPDARVPEPPTPSIPCFLLQ